MSGGCLERSCSCAPDKNWMVAETSGRRWKEIGRSWPYNGPKRKTVVTILLIIIIIIIIISERGGGGGRISV